MDIGAYSVFSDDSCCHQSCHGHTDFGTWNANLHKKKTTTFNYTEIKQRFLLILGEETNIDKS